MCIGTKNHSSIEFHYVLMVKATHYFGFSYKQFPLLWTKVASQNNINLQNYILIILQEQQGIIEKCW